MRIDQRKFTAISTRGHEPIQEERLAGAWHSTSVVQAALQARYNLTSRAKDERREAGMLETWILRTRNRLTSMQTSLHIYYPKECNMRVHFIPPVLSKWFPHRITLTANQFNFTSQPKNQTRIFKANTYTNAK